MEGRGRQEIGLNYGSDDPNDSGVLDANIILRRYYYLIVSISLGIIGPGNVNTVDFNAGKRFRQRFLILSCRARYRQQRREAILVSIVSQRRLACFTTGIGSGETRIFIKAGKSGWRGTITEIILPIEALIQSRPGNRHYNRSRGTLPDKPKGDGTSFKQAARD